MYSGIHTKKLPYKNNLLAQRSKLLRQSHRLAYIKGVYLRISVEPESKKKRLGLFISKKDVLLHPVSRASCAQVARLI